MELALFWEMCPTMADVTGNPVVTFMVPLPDNMAALTPVAGALSDRLKL